MINFNINNISGQPLSYNGQIIQDQQSYCVTSDHLTFIKETFLLPHVAAGAASISAGGVTVFGKDAVTLLVALSTNASSVYHAIASPAANNGRIDLDANLFGELSIQFRNLSTRITGNSITMVKGSPGRMHGLVINDNSTGGTITIYEGIDASGTVLFQLQIGTPLDGLLSTNGKPGPVFLGPLGLEFSKGLTVVTSGSPGNDITVLYQ